MAGGAGWAGAPAALLRSVRRLREVFEVCGRDPDGFLRMERIAALGLRFGRGEELFLDMAGSNQAVCFLVYMESR
ncbi:rab11 family-interacting protein 4-like [Cavia porcellus]|uniref:rab11 family-interacting protein 4-like n=1 Tax=Cavia porcellus TaxID=10141 RepID=UPI002FE1807C